MRCQESLGRLQRFPRDVWTGTAFAETDPSLLITRHNNHILRKSPAC